MLLCDLRLDHEDLAGEVSDFHLVPLAKKERGFQAPPELSLKFLQAGAPADTLGDSAQQNMITGTLWGQQRVFTFGFGRFRAEGMVRVTVVR